MFSDEITSRKKLGKTYYTNSNYRRLREKRRTLFEIYYVHANGINSIKMKILRNQYAIIVPVLKTLNISRMITMLITHTTRLNI